MRSILHLPEDTGARDMEKCLECTINLMIVKGVQ